MKKLYRRSISGLMALLICFTTILGGGITAFAASSSGEVAKSYSIQNTPWKDRAFQLWSASWRFILGRRDDCLFYLRYYYSANCRTYAYEEHLQCFQELFAAVEQTFKPEANVNMLLHQVFDTMLSFAARVLGGEMPDDDATTQWAFEQIYSFVVPNVREELLISSGSTPA